jgi:DNA-binding winged helix-turn-helix (wHTH) protein/TolB-like protein/Tfp pilus assembly protein PilF
MAKDLYKFGVFQLDPSRRRLLRAGEPATLTPKAFDTLLVLVENHGQRMTRSELIAKIWPDTLVEDHNLNQCVAVLRKVLQDSPRQPNYIATLPGQGYSFIADVERVSNGAGSEAWEPKDPASDSGAQRLGDPGRDSTATGARPLRWARPNTYTLAAVVLVLAAVTLAIRSEFRPAKAASHSSLSLIPFASLGMEPREQYIAEGLTEEITAELAQVPGLKVVAAGRQSLSGNIPELAKQLRVDSVLKGSVRNSGGQYRIAVQLVSGDDGRDLWSSVFDGSVADLPAIESQVLKQTANALKVAEVDGSAGQQVVSKPPNPEAHDLYLQARYLWSKRDDESVQRSIQLFREAIQKDPSYARAYAGLADAYAVVAVNNPQAIGVAAPQAKATAQKALQLDPGLAEPHATLGLMKLFADWDWSGAQEEFNRALTINPGYATAHHWAAQSLTAQGKFAAADAELRTAQELDPLSPMISEGRFENFYFWRRYDDALQVIRNLQAREPEKAAGFSWALGHAYIAKHRYREAIDELEKTMAVKPENAVWLAQAKALTGDPDAALAILQRADTTGAKLDTLPSFMARLCLAVGDKERAMRWLDRAYRERDSIMPYLAWDQDFDPLRNDPRFIDLVSKTNSAR